MKIDGLSRDQQLRFELVDLLVRTGVCCSADDIEATAADLERYINDGADPSPGALAERIAQDATALGRSLQTGR